MPALRGFYEKDANKRPGRKASGTASSNLSEHVNISCEYLILDLGCGGGLGRTHLEGGINSLGLQNNVKLLGTVVEKEKYQALSKPRLFIIK